MRILAPFLVLALALVSMTAQGKELKATHQDYLNLYLDISTAKPKQVVAAYASLEKILDDQLTLADRYKSVIEEADAFNAENGITRENYEDSRTYSMIEKVRDAQYVGGPWRTSDIANFTFINKEMSKVWKGPNGQEMTNWGLLSSKALTVMGLFLLRDDASGAVSKALTLQLIQKYDARLTKKINGLKALSKADRFHNSNGNPVVDGLIHSFLYMIAFDYSIAANEDYGLRALEFLSEVQDLNLAKETKDIIALGLKITRERAPGHMAFEGSKIVRRSQQEVIDLRRSANPRYGELFDKVFSGFKNQKNRCSTLLSKK